MKSRGQLKPNYAPVYAAEMYPGLCKIFHKHGYALAVHGSLARDFDIIAVPWRSVVSTEKAVLRDVESEYAVRIIGKGSLKEHGRVAYTLSVGFGQCAVDLSFFPAV